MRRTWSRSAVAATAILVAAAAHAQPASPPPPREEASGASMTVTGRRHTTRSDVADFVTAVMAAPRNDRVARWADRLCLAIAGLDDARRDFFAAEIASVANRLRLTVAQEHCDPSAYIIFSGEPDALLRRLEQERPAFFGAIPRVEQRPLRDSRAAVRWLSWAQLRGASGELPVAFAVPPTGGAVERPMPSARTTPSRLATGMRADLQAMVVIVDTTGLTGISYRSLADYLAMVVLGNVRQDHRPTALPSILGLFDTAGGGRGTAPAQLTDWDLSYLTSLYSGAWNMPADRRIGVIQAAMRRRLD